jgi:hypothetical protein
MVQKSLWVVEHLNERSKTWEFTRDRIYLSREQAYAYRNSPMHRFFIKSGGYKTRVSRYMHQSVVPDCTNCMGTC